MNYSETLEIGRQFQDFILLDMNKQGISFTNYTSKKYQYSVGENTAGVEIKHDMKFRQTGNLFIEVETKAKNGEWYKSGIYNNDNTWLFLIGDENTNWVFGKRCLQRVLKKSEFRVVTTPDSRGYLLPVKYANTLAEKVGGNG